MSKVLIDAPLTVRKGVQYIVVKQHRILRNAHKTRWTITPVQEFKCFVLAESNGWTESFVGWGLHVAGGVAKHLGVNSQREHLLFAKFVDSGKSSIWHGYPADYRRRSANTPSERLLETWVHNKLIGKRMMAKILQGQEC